MKINIMQIYIIYFFIIAIPNVKLYILENHNKKICADCKFFISNKNKCSKFGDLDIITGISYYEDAIKVRNDDNKCGKGIFCARLTKFPENNTLNPKNNAPMLALIKSCLEKCSGVWSINLSLMRSTSFLIKSVSNLTTSSSRLICSISLKILHLFNF